MTDALPGELEVLARRHRLETRFRDGRGEWRQASLDSIVAALDALDATPGRAGGLPARGRTAMVEPVVVAWDGAGAAVLRLEPSRAGQRLECHLDLEGGTIREWSVPVDGLDWTDDPGADGRRRHLRSLPLEAMPLGCHRLRLTCGTDIAESWVLSSPSVAWGWTETPGVGVFVPLHALHSAESWGVGDLSDLRRLNDWFETLGVRSTGVLPLLAVDYTGEPCDPSPYRPVSRLFWNDLFVDPRGLPEFETCEQARALVRSPGFVAELQRSGTAELVDYPAALSARRRVLGLLADHAAESGGGWGAVARWADAHPWARRFARFRADRERPLPGGVAWHERHHLYAQWAAQRQVDALADHATGLYLDLPLGVAPDGFDPMAFPEAFAEGVETGAPPDELFPEGQCWGTPPPHPLTARVDGYRYLRASLAHHLSVARCLRLDHVMGVHRLYWVPSGATAADGVYVHYPTEELQAVVTLESWRHRTPVVGENLGTVPDYVEDTLTRRCVGRLHVAQFQVRREAPVPLAAPQPSTVASMNTHDTPTFAGFLAGRDIEERRQRGALSADRAAEALATRQQIKAALQRLLPAGAEKTDHALLQACLARLAEGSADLLLVSLEDLWLETRPQNVPGTGPDRNNWRGRAAYALEPVMGDTRISSLLSTLVAAMDAQR